LSYKVHAFRLEENVNLFKPGLMSGVFVQKRAQIVLR